MVAFELDDLQRDWLSHQLRKEGITKWQLIETIADASFRCYHRIAHPQGSYILMQFLPDKEDGKRIVQTAEFFLAHGIRVPQLHSYDISLGLVLQEDMGTELLAARSSSEAAAIDSSLYYKAVDELIRLQKLDAAELGFFSREQQLQEMQLFTEWFLSGWLGYEASPAQLDDYYHLLVGLLAAAPQSCLHMDFHSRNLVLLPNDAIGVLDYQDARTGHFCYDMVSLLRDAYIRLPDELTEELMRYWMAKVKPFFGIKDEEFFHYHFALMTLQRCIKVCGTFARLYLRDNKPRYLNDIPLVLSHLNRAANGVIGSAASQLSEAENQEMQNKHRFFCRLLADLEPVVREKIGSALPSEQEG